MQTLKLWGYHWQEYKNMFALQQMTAKKPVLEYCCGPSAVNFERKELGLATLSYDPLFKVGNDALRDEVLTKFKVLEGDFISAAEDIFKSDNNKLKSFIDSRKEGLKIFLDDFANGTSEKRYVGSDNHTLPFADNEFSVALSAYHLFLTGRLSFDDQLATIKELCRVAEEVRIFPLIDKFEKPSALLGPMLLALQKQNFGTEVCEVSYALQKTGNAMLKVWSRECQLDNGST